MVGLLLCVFVHDSHAHATFGAHTEMVRTGFSGLSGNKGGMIFRLTLQGFALCFVNLHLPSGAGAEAKEARNAAFREVLRGAALGFAAATLAGCKTPLPPPLEHAAIFCFGDLNYRLSLPNKEVRWALRCRDWSKLLVYDQLAPQLGEPGECEPGSAFAGFEEAAIYFRPTYKYDVGTNKFDSSEKSRAPAWTDRALWHIGLPRHSMQVCHAHLALRGPLTAPARLGRRCSCTRVAATR